MSGVWSAWRMPTAEVEATVAAIERRVRERQGLPADGPDEAPAEARSALTEAMEAAHISAHTPILWDLPVIGRGIALTKRVVRILLRWYINPIVDQQNDFNAAVVRALGDLAEENERLRVALEALRAEQAAVGAGGGDRQ
ncbi:MAG TPA: hypothetical protein VIL85_26010 [Thermomicrobiales bacterium]